MPSIPDPGAVAIGVGARVTSAAIRTSGSAVVGALHASERLLRGMRTSTVRERRPRVPRIMRARVVTVSTEQTPPLRTPAPRPHFQRSDARAHETARRAELIDHQL